MKLKQGQASGESVEKKKLEVEESVGHGSRQDYIHSGAIYDMFPSKT